MSYCPIALLDDIRGGSNGTSNDSSSCGVDVEGSSASRDDIMIQVQFPHLPSQSQPPTDSEVTTATTSTTATATTTSDQEVSDMENSKSTTATARRCSSDPDTEGSDEQQQDEQKGPAAAEAAASRLKSPPEKSNQPSQQHPHQASTSSNAHQDNINATSDHNSDTDNEEDMMEIEIDTLDFTSHPDPAQHQAGTDASVVAANQIRSALTKLVVTVKRRRKRQQEKKKKKAQQQQQQPGQQQQPHGHHQVMAKEVGGAQEVQEGGSHHQEEGRLREDRKPSLKQRPIQIIMTWMDSFQDHENIQLICLQALPTILEDPPTRLAAQADGLASIVLYNMAAFPNNSLLQLTAFHTLVVLLRPLGANEGMVHKAHVHNGNSTRQSSKGIRSINHKNHHPHHHHQHHHHSQDGQSSSINSPLHHSPSSSKRGTKKKTMSSIIDPATALLDASYEPRWEENGVRVMLDSLRRFSSDRYLQAMGCWAMVNAALYPSLKASLLRLGGVYTVTNAMMLHPNVEAVQFRGLFALINLVIPDKSKKDGDGSSIHSHIYQIARLTILAMKNFHTNKSILNRGCLVLRNLSLTPAFVKILARTPGCVDMLLHCRQMCPRDVLVQRSARTIMILVQRVTEKKENDKDIFKLTQPTTLGSSMAAASGSSSFALSTATSRANSRASSSTPASMPKLGPRES